MFGIFTLIKTKLNKIKSNKVRRFSILTLASAILIVLLASCSSIAVKDTRHVNESPQGQLSSEDPEELIAQDKLAEAAMLYLAIANNASSPQKQNIQLKAIDLLIKDKLVEVASNLLLELNLDDLNIEQITFYAYLSAKVAINERNPKQSQQWLRSITVENSAAFATEADIIRLYIATYELASNIKNATLKRIALDRHLKTDEEILINQQAIIRGLLALHISVLQNITQIESAYNIRAWVNLSLLVKNAKNPFRLGNQLKIWQDNNPQLSIQPSLIAALAPHVDDVPPNLENIALLLPLSGPFSKPATAIRNGFLASYYANINSGNLPTVRIYDTGGVNSNILAIYQEAIDNGANIIVGPLRKKAIKEIALNTNHNIPTLALNQLDNIDFYSENFYQFSLSPEDEAKQTARRAWLDGHSRAAVISPNNKWGKRVATAFNEEWEKLGGEITSNSSYNAKKSDFSKPIKTLLAIDKSRDRRRALSKLLRVGLKFEPRRRQDIDFVFMAAFPKQARLIPPQLKFYHATSIPIYATSHSFSGWLNRKKDRDLDNVTIGDMPWTLTGTRKDSYKREIYKTWPNSTRRFNRLYAFGTDSYNVLYYLNWLRSNNLSRLRGTTGELHMSENNQVLRNLSWAKFSKGRAKLLPATTMLSEQ